MEKTLPGKNSFRTNRASRFFAGVLALLLAAALTETAFAQQVTVGGTVRNAAGQPLQGVSVRVMGTDTRTLTSTTGRYTITAPSDAVLNYSLLGQRVVQMRVEGRSQIDVQMEPIAYLEEVVVTAYTEQRRADITGAVGSVNLDAASRQTSASMLQRLDATVPGITVANSGSPGSRSTVRVRGVSSFQNNDPLYIVDGTPVTDSYINWLNPNDIASIQVLKDASAASIYGSRASNGVIVIETTKRGIQGPPRTRLSIRSGLTNPVRGYDDFLILNALDYHRIIKAAYLNAKLAVPTNIYGDPNNPTLPQYTFAHSSLVTASDVFGRPTTVNTAGYSYPNVLVMGASAGTNWWKEVFGSGFMNDYNLDVGGGSEENQYSVSFNFFDQKGTAAHNYFRRGTARVNTAFQRGRLSFGENIAIAVERANGGLPDDPGGYAEDGILGKNILMQPVIPVHDIQGNFASGKATTLGNQTNPLKFAAERKDNTNKNDRIFGNIFGAVDIVSDLKFRTRLGFNLGQGAFQGFTPITPENSEAQFTNAIFESNDNFSDWTLSNTMTYDRTFMNNHNLTLLAGQEANAGRSRHLEAGLSNLISNDPNIRYVQDVIGDAGSKTVLSRGARSALLSFFGKADYNFADRYIASFTIRRDGSSRLAPAHRWGTFPAFGLGWRLSNESFLMNSKLFSDVMLRFGWGITGNQQVPAGRNAPQFGGSRGDTFYALGGGNSTSKGLRLTAIGNPDLKWEENRSTNVGADLGLWDGKVNVVLDVYRRETNNLLFDPPTPGTQGTASPAIVNVGKMKNTGLDFSVGHSSPTWSATFTGSTYKNEIVRIDGDRTFFYGPISTRFGNQIINQIGQPIGSFYGLVADGLFRDAADVAAHATQDGAAPGRIKFRDVNGDGAVTLADRTIIGSPHPDFTGSLDLSYRRGNWDASTTFFGSFGNEIFDVQKEFYVFRNFSTNVRKDLLTDTWTPVDNTVPRAQYTAANPDAKYPILDQADNFSRALSSFYVEDGSYVRMRSLQIGYSVPATTRFIRLAPGTRIYGQVENLFTITGYDGLDPSLPAANIFGAAGDIRDQYRGIDRGTYPSNRTFSIGIITSF